MKKVKLVLGVFCLALLSACCCCNNKEKAGECQKMEKKCCAVKCEMTEEQKEFKAKWENFENLAVEEQKELIAKKKACIEKCKAEKKEAKAKMQAIKEELEAKWEKFEELAIEEQKELLDKKAGVFVSIHKNGRLRGCIGTISPTTDSIAKEIIRNAVSAGLNDTRFEKVEKSELPFLVYKVDILAAPEAISGPEELDVKRYGVIVTSGFRRGLLLPNLDGIDTVEEQISIAKQKAGISKNENVKLERFEVVRYQ